MTYGWYPQHRTHGPEEPGLGVVVHQGMPLPGATAGHRWLARLIDATLILALSLGWALTCAGLTQDRGLAILLVGLGYVVVLVLAGGLYGVTASPGQLMAGVVSLQTHTGQPVGFWWGALRYVITGLVPLWLAIKLWEALTGGAAQSWGWSRPVSALHRSIPTSTESRQNR